MLKGARRGDCKTPRDVMSAIHDGFNVTAALWEAAEEQSPPAARTHWAAR
jgi:hypothetical protein